VRGEENYDIDEEALLVREGERRTAGE